MLIYSKAYIQTNVFSFFGKMVLKIIYAPSRMEPEHYVYISLYEYIWRRIKSIVFRIDYALSPQGLAMW